VDSYLLLLEVLTSLFQTGYDTLLFQTGFLHFGIVSHHSLLINLGTIQIIMGLPIELVKLNILLLQVLNFPRSLFCLLQLTRHVLVFMLDPIQFSFDCERLFLMVLQSPLHCF